MTTVQDIIRVMELLAPADLAEAWDNPGLQVGGCDWRVASIWVALDPTPEIVDAACRAQADLLITHHPLIFRSLKTIDVASPLGTMIHKALQYNLAIFCAHTNLDSVSNGLNDVLAARLGLKDLSVLGESRGGEVCKLMVYVPVAHERAVLDAIFKSGFGRIGPYSCCSFRHPGTGTFRPARDAQPFQGQTGQVNHVEEVRIEVVVPRAELTGLLAQLQAVHPYETMAYDVLPLISSKGSQGLGRLGKVDPAMSLEELARKVKRQLALPAVRVAGRLDQRISEAALCSGSGSGLLSAFLSSGAQVFISGDLRYHDAREVEFVDRGLIDIGHFSSEHLIVEVLAQRLQNELSQRGLNVAVKAYEDEREPFVLL